MLTPASESSAILPLFSPFALKFQAQTYLQIDDRMLSRKCSPSHRADLLPKMIPTGSRRLNGYSVPQRETSSSKFPPSQYSTNRWKDELVSCAEDALHMKSNNTLIWCAKTNCTTQKTEKLEVQVIPRWLACS